MFTITPLLRSLDISGSMISVSAGKKFQGGTNYDTDTSANSIVKPNFTIYKTNWSYVIFAFFSKQFVKLPPLNFGKSYCGMPLWPAMDLLVGLSFFGISRNFRLFEGCG